MENITIRSTILTEIILYLSLQAAVQPAEVKLPWQQHIVMGITHTHFLLPGDGGRTIALEQQDSTFSQVAQRGRAFKKKN